MGSHSSGHRQSHGHRCGQSCRRWSGVGTYCCCICRYLRCRDWPGRWSAGRLGRHTSECPHTLCQSFPSSCFISRRWSACSRVAVRLGHGGRCGPWPSRGTPSSTYPYIPNFILHCFRQSWPAASIPPSSGVSAAPTAATRVPRCQPVVNVRVSALNRSACILGSPGRQGIGVAVRKKPATPYSCQVSRLARRRSFNRDQAISDCCTRIR